MQPELISFPDDLMKAFDQEAVRREITERFKVTKRLPGEPKLRVELAHRHPISSPMECPEEERSRRAKMGRYKSFIRVLVNSKEVSRTTSASLNDQFILSFNQSFPIQLTHNPSSITLQLWEQSDSGSELIVSEVYLDIPDPATSRSSVQPSTLDFSSDRVLRFESGDNGRVSSLLGLLFLLNSA